MTRRSSSRIGALALALALSACASPGGAQAPSRPPPDERETSAPVRTDAGAGGAGTNTASPSVRVAPPPDVEVLGTPDPALLAAGAAVIAALEEPAALRALIAPPGLLVYDEHACAPNRLPAEELDEAGLRRRFRVDTCFDDTPGEDAGAGPAEGVEWRWGDYLSALAEQPAVARTDLVALDVAEGPGLDTGTRHRVEQRFAGDRYRIVRYRHAGSAAKTRRDWRELGLVFEDDGGTLRLVALYEDRFSPY